MRPPDAAHADPIAGALALHAWAGALLLDDVVQTPPAVDVDAWHIFLRADACALPLAQRLGALGMTPEPARAAVLDELSAAELRRTLSAHQQLRLLAGIARAHALPIAVLKGGASVANGRALELKDLDVLAAPGRAHELAAALDALGYETMSDDASQRDRAGAPHLTGRIVAGAIRIEIHEWLVSMPSTDALLARATPLPVYADLLQLGAADHLWHVVHHTAIQHPERRGRLRDRLLLRDAAAACDAADRAEVDARVSASPRPAPLCATLAAASGTPMPTAARAPFDDAVAARLALLARFPRYRRHRYWREVVDHALALVSTERSWSAELLDTRAEERRTPSAIGAVAWAESRLPGVARAVRHLLIGVRAALAAPIAAYAVAAGRRAARALGAAPRAAS